MENPNDPQGPPAPGQVPEQESAEDAAERQAEAALAADQANGNAHVIGFEDLGLSDEALKTIRDAGYLTPTPIQEQAIPAVLDGLDVIGSAQTGTGKTATFTIPICELLAGRGGTLAVVLSPTREIANQTADAFEIFGKPRGVNACVLIGGVEMKPQLEALKTYPQVIVATPGRLVDHIERGSVWLDYVEVVVLDEADRMLDMGFMPQITRILSEIPQDRQTLLFSATIPPPIEKLTRTMMQDPIRIAVGKPLAAASTVDQELWVAEPNRKIGELRKILREEAGTIFVFTRSKKSCVELWQSLHSAGHYDVTMLHSDRTQEQRMQAMADFKGGKYRVMIATDVAARGIDVANVALVVNFDLPFNPEDYVHRIGRSGRANAKGRSITIATYQDKRLLHDIEKLLGGPIRVARNTSSGGGGSSEGRREGGREERSRGGRGGRGGRSGRGGGRPGGGARAGGGAPTGGEGVAPVRVQSAGAQAASPQGQAQGANAAPGPGGEGGMKRRRRRRGGRGRHGRGGGAPGGNGASGMGGAPSGGEPGPGA